MLSTGGAGGREHSQWAFLAAETDLQQQQQDAGAAAAAAAEPIAILAVRLVGNSPTCIDWLEPSSVSNQQQQAAAVTPAGSTAGVKAAGSTGPMHTRTATRRLAVTHQQGKQQQQGSRETLVLFRNLILQRLDAANGMWVAVAPDTAEVMVAAASKGSLGGGAAAAARVAELRSWAGQQQQQQLGVLRAHVQRLVGVS